jgi:tRNA A37 threonylcarbamoyladenosine modification protein TsaB
MLFREDKLIAEVKRDNFQRHSENFIACLQKLLAANQLSLEKVKQIYLTLNPGGQTGIRVSLSFLSALRLLQPHLEIFYIDTLLFQAGTTIS